jgi:DNA invertase Pin-like site-specific DNA recombinase
LLTAAATAVSDGRLRGHDGQHGGGPGDDGEHEREVNEQFLHAGPPICSSTVAERCGLTLRVFAEKQSGAKTDRAVLARCIASLEPGDTLLVTKLDRPARSTRDLLNALAAIGEAGASFRSLADAWADTTTPHGRLMLTVLGGLAEFERHLILSRTNEERIRAKARGIRFGRKPKLTKHQQQEALARRAAGEALADIARTFGVSHSTISRLAGVTFMQ